MTTENKISMAQMATSLFEIGLALKLRKVPMNKITKHLSFKNIRIAVKEIESKKSWDDSHLSKGEILNAALEVHEITQAALAKKMGVTNQKVNDLVHERLALNVNWAKKIGKALGVNYKVLL